MDPLAARRGGQRATGAAIRRVLPDLKALGHRDYRLLWSGQLVMNALMPLQFVTGLLWLQAAAPEHLRLLLAGLLGATRGGAMLLMGLVGGALADRLDRRHLLLTTQTIALTANALIALLLLSGRLGGISLAAFLLLSFVAGGAMAVDMPTRQALVTELVPRAHLANAIALDAVAMQVSLPASLVASGLLIDGLGFGGAYACGLVGHVAVLLALTRLRPHAVRRPVAGQTSFLRTVRDGIAFVRRTPTVLWVLVLLVVVMALGFPPVASMGPVWVTRVLGLSPAQFGWFAATWGLGALGASLIMTTVGHFPRKGWLVGLGAIGFAACVVGWGHSRSVPLSAVLNFSLGALLSVTQIAARALVQRTVPHAMQGRVMSLFMLNMAVAQLMTAPVGALAQVLTFELVVPVLGWISLGLAVGIVLMRADIRRAGTAGAVL